VGAYVGYKTDHDPYERATSAGPKTSEFMSECLQRELEDYGIGIYDGQEVAELITAGTGEQKRIAGVACLDLASLKDDRPGINVYVAANVVLAAGGPGALYETTVYPEGQIGIHGLAFKAGLAAENLTELQFGLASIDFRWNVSGTYMQAVPRIYSTDASGGNERDFLADYFPSMCKMATAIFLKGYQWPFDPARITGYGSSLIDVLVHNETQAGRRVFLDFRENPRERGGMNSFSVGCMEQEAKTYLESAGALQERPIERLAHMNELAIDIYKENGIDLWSEPLEIAVCAQHCNGGFAVNKWWESSIPHTFVIGEMAGTHGVKRPGGAALNAGQVGGLRAAQYIANVYGTNPQGSAEGQGEIRRSVSDIVDRFTGWAEGSDGLLPKQILQEVQRRMTAEGAHIRSVERCEQAVRQSIELFRRIENEGLSLTDVSELPVAIQAEHIALCSVAYLRAILEYLRRDGGSRGSYIVMDYDSYDSIEAHPGIIDPNMGELLKYRPENTELRDIILRLTCDLGAEDLFSCRETQVRKAYPVTKAFEIAWKEYREGRIYD
jgi:succinate dehydrogenase/fumarate reductase flavoprotein subunit